jgi:hypothetical protein
MEREVGVLFGGPMDGLLFTMTGFRSLGPGDQLFLAEELLITDRKVIQPMWPHAPLTPPRPVPAAHYHYRLDPKAEGNRYDYVGIWSWSEYG